MGRLGTGWLGLLGAAELLLEEALMGTFDSGWSGLDGAALDWLGTAWMGLLGAAEGGGGDDAERAKGRLAGLGGG
jgi:hypothetical protein